MEGYKISKSSLPVRETLTPEQLLKMDYKPPVQIIQEQMLSQLDRDVMHAIQRYQIFVDKDELIKALNYDRDQYEKGFADGCRHNVDELCREVEKRTVEAIRAALHANRSSRDGITFKLVDLKTIDHVIDEFLKEH
jgi:hypothetical protein